MSKCTFSFGLSSSTNLYATSSRLLLLRLTRAVTECDLIPPPACALTETSILYTDGHMHGRTHGWMDTRTDGQADSSVPTKTFVLRGYNSL